MNGSSLPLPPVLSSRLSDFRRRVWIVKLAEGILAAVFGLALSWLLVLGLDRLFETPAWLRGTLLVLGAAVPGLGLPLMWHRWVWRQRRLEDAARLLRWKFPRLGDQLLGIVELAHSGAGSGRSERLVAAAMAQADEAVKDQDFRDAVPRAKHRQWGWAAAGAAALVVTAFSAIPEAARNAFARWLMPWRDTERFTFARVNALPDPLVVPVAESFTLPVDLAADTRWSPESASGKIPGQPDISAGREEGAYVLAFPPQKADTELALKVGDVRRTVQVQPRPRPELTALNVRLKLPDYLQYETEPVLEIRGGSVSVLGGATATFEATASRALAEAAIDGTAARIDGGTLTSAPQPVSEARDVTFTWKDELGLTALAPLVLQVKPVADEAPKIVARRETQEQVVLDSEVVVFEIAASDDFGVRQTGLQWKAVDAGQGMPEKPATGEKISAAGAPETKQLETRATFCAAREGVAPQTLEVRAWARDYLSEREPSRSAAFILHVLNQTDHALWVTQQMGKWLEAARETYEREQQLHETNKELRAMSAEELDRPENRRRVAQQAASENANAERLASLNNAGKNLVEQATKNPEFDAPRLESWATMLESLKNIADQRMPSVADLLKQSADAKAGQLAGSPAGKSGEAKPGTPSSAQASPSGEAKPGEGKTGDAKPGESTPQTAQNNSQPGDAKPGEANPQTAQNSQTPPAGSEAKAGEASKDKTAPQIAQGPQPAPGNKPAAPQDPDAKPVQKAPSIKLTESTMNKPDASAPEEPGKPKPPSPGKLTLPTNSLAAAPGQKADPPAPETPAQESLDQGVAEQKDLLTEFAKVSDQLSEILGSLEASTFVKRLKAASQKQQQLAGSISEKTLDAFGIVREQPGMELEDLPPAQEEPTSFLRFLLGGAAANLPAAQEPEAAGEVADAGGTPEKPDAEPVTPDNPPVYVTTFAPEASGVAKTQSEIVRTIQGDLEAYTQRKQDAHFGRVLKEMKELRVITALTSVGDRAADNLSGTAIHGAEYWADTLDRWAEEMVKAAGKCSNCSSCKGDSLPPEIVLKVMQALRDEMTLRDETREAENAKPALERQDYLHRTAKLFYQQGRIARHVATALQDILELPEGQQKFGKELKLLDAVVQVMTETTTILEQPETGDPAIAAETEAIELLLQTKRQNPKGGGGGGADPGGGGSAASASSAALANLGPGSDAAAEVISRPVGQSTGRAGREFPEEFRTGLDAYFSNLEGTRNP